MSKQNIAFKAGEILIPKKEFLEDWAVVACDQFTSQPKYWEQVEEQTKDKPSAFHIILPEARLDREGQEETIEEIHSTMEEYIKEDYFDRYPNALIYTERTLHNGEIRKGIVGLLDLTCYDYTKGATTLVRATEATVVERIPPRVKVRKNAALDNSHVLMLVDDPEKTVIEELSNKKEEMEKIYDFDLMMHGGNTKGYLIPEQEVASVLSHLADLMVGEHPMLFAAGDGNHSLASAKESYRQITEHMTEEEALRHPTRYALVEVNNLHEESLVFEAIHRVVFGVSQEEFMSEWEKYGESESIGDYKQSFIFVDKEGKKAIEVASPTHPLSVGTVQQFLDAHPDWEIDYVHGEDAVNDLVEQGAIGILLDSIEKSSLFPAVVAGGALPRKTFSMGEAVEKRYYLETRKLTV